MLQPYDACLYCSWTARYGRTAPFCTAITQPGKNLCYGPTVPVCTATEMVAVALRPIPEGTRHVISELSLIHISEPTRPRLI
eukprot:747404-Rhodomonas_salina.1